ncbi:ubiquitin-conjugating enzyme/RWD-like protein [Naematelia encephala]|uniref:Ubiquitin-conjugating enzyme/RWD-like protein n=1 Tax=Naematelia encephala TaxID=71784 RepID=A0A1Y2BBF5_9TREE|nr:ubiquitin-conjugating enzyme/RWD-like protein [Naematelia encephala]
MADHQAILDEEFEVLESIFPDELEKVDERHVKIRVEPEEPSTSYPLSVYLAISYPSTYPDTIPELSFETIDEESGELTEEESEDILSSLQTLAEESIGMAMTFTIASAAKEALSGIIAQRIRKAQEEDDRRTKEYEEIEARKTRGTPLTPEGFEKWKRSFQRELEEKRAREEEDRIRSMPQKEKEEWKKRRDRPSGKQLFETSHTLATSDEALYEEGVTEVDMSKYTRAEREAERRREEEEEERRRRGLVAGDESDGE